MSGEMMRVLSSPGRERERVWSRTCSQAAGHHMVVVVVRLSVLSYYSTGDNDNMNPPHHHVPPHHTSSHAYQGQHRLRRPRHGAARQVGDRGGHLRLQQHEHQPLGNVLTRAQTSNPSCSSKMKYFPG